MSVSVWITLLGALALLALLLCLWQLRTLGRMQREIAALTLKVNENRAATTQEGSFSSHLVAAEKVHFRNSAESRSGAEKYRYVAGLADQGIDAEGIAAALGMAATEVEQLIRLSQLKKSPGREH